MKVFHFLALVAVTGLMLSCDSSQTGNNAEMTPNEGIVQTGGKNVDERLDDTDQYYVQGEGSDFVKEAVKGSMLEVELGEIAQQKASSQAVKDFGQRMVTDHGEANAELKALATEMNIDIPTSLPDDAQEDIDKLSQLSGQEFDKEYMSMMVEEHNKDVKAFEDASEKVENAAIRNFASATLSILKEHQQMADSINQQLQNI